jgi:hypothetical protein
MTRAQAIATITRTLETFDDESVQVVAEIVSEMDTAPATPIRALSAREQSLLVQSKADFTAGRTVTLDESRARTDALFARFAAAQSKTA